MKITEQYILLQAPNAAAATNGRNLSRKGSFLGHGRNADSNVYWAECAGSGKNLIVPPLTSVFPNLPQPVVAAAQAGSFHASTPWA